MSFIYLRAVIHIQSIIGRHVVEKMILFQLIDFRTGEAQTKLTLDNIRQEFWSKLVISSKSDFIILKIENYLQWKRLWILRVNHQ